MKPVPIQADRFGPDFRVPAIATTTWIAIDPDRRHGRYIPAYRGLIDALAEKTVDFRIIPVNRSKVYAAVAEAL